MLYSILLHSLLACSSKLPPNVGQGAEVMPEPQAFVFGPGDIIDVRVWKQPELDMQIAIAPDGAISYPLLGRIQVAGKTYPELIQTLEGGLADYYTEPQVAVNVVEVTNQKVFVLGEVRTPLVLQVENEISVIEALTRSGGINSESRTDNMLLVRGGMEDPQLFTIRVEDIFTGRDLAQNISLQRGDILLVPSRTIVNVERFFRRMQSVMAPFVAGSAVYRNTNNNLTPGGPQQ